MAEIIVGIAIALFLVLWIAFVVSSDWLSDDRLPYSEFRSFRDDPGQKIAATYKYKKWLQEGKTPTVQAQLLNSGPPLINKSAIQWHVLQNRDVQPSYMKQIASRCNADDLVLLSLTSTAGIDFTEKRTLYHSLENLRRQGEWRHLGLLPEYAKVYRSTHSRQHPEYDLLIALNNEIRKLLCESGQQQLDQIGQLLCKRHFRRFIQRDAYGVAYAICPVCKQPQHHLQIKKVIAVLDQRYGWTSAKSADTLYVNYLKLKAPFDFDSVHIGRCTPDEIDMFIVEAANDPYIKGPKQGEKVSYRVLPGVELEESSRRKLEKLFVPM